MNGTKILSLSLVKQCTWWNVHYAQVKTSHARIPQLEKQGTETENLDGRQILKHTKIHRISGRTSLFFLEHLSVMLQTN